MSSEEFSEWKVFFALEPFGFDAEFLGHAQTAAVIANVNRPEGQAPFKVEDFMPQKKQSQSVDEMIQFASMFTAALGGEVDIEEQNG